MPKMKNKGVSMVEILISITIFAILMIPIVSGIISSMNNTTNAKTLQYRNEYIENIIEYVKEESLENILAGKYFSDNGSFTDTSDPVNVSVDFYKKTDAATYDLNLKPLADLATDKGWTLNVKDSDVMDGVGIGAKSVPYEVYTVSGKVKLGTKHKTYAYKMEISNKYYAQKEIDSSYVNPNNLALGVVEDIDHTKVALINGTIANYDTAVSNAFMTKKLEVLKEKNPDWYDIYINQAEATNLFPNDTATRKIILKVSGSETKGYTVTCGLVYHDNSTNSTVQSALANYNIEYMPFEYNYPIDPTTKKAVLPNIYLMYNVCLYNGRFSSDDYIVFDTTEMEDDTPINCFVVQTAEKYSTNLAEANPDLDASKTLYNNQLTTDAVVRNDINIHMVAVKGSKLSNLYVYHNFDNGSPNMDANKKNEKLLYRNTDAGLFDSTLPTTEYVPLVSYQPGTGSPDPSSSAAAVGSLDSATAENRGLYQVKLWMAESDNIDDVDTSANPVMTATKGGDES